MMIGIALVGGLGTSHCVEREDVKFARKAVSAVIVGENFKKPDFLGKIDEDRSATYYEGAEGNVTVTVRVSKITNKVTDFTLSNSEEAMGSHILAAIERAYGEARDIVSTMDSEPSDNPGQAVGDPGSLFDNQLRFEESKKYEVSPHLFRRWDWLNSKVEGILTHREPYTWNRKDNNEVVTHSPGSTYFDLSVRPF
tara:strand:- start:6426 stop:7013 length:588 start_codon:yes stop_codon:yes gene_type:complete